MLKGIFSCCYEMFHVSFSCVFISCVHIKEPIRIPSATMSLTDDLEDDASSLLVTTLMLPGSNVDGTNISPGRQIVRSAVTAAAAAAGGVSNGDMKSTLTDSAAVTGHDSTVDMSPERRNADNLHQLSLYVFVFIVALRLLCSMWEGTSLIHDFTAMVFPMKLAVLHEKCTLM